MKHRYNPGKERIFVVQSCDPKRGRATVNGVDWERISLRMNKACMLCMRRMQRNDLAYRPFFPDTINPVYVRLCPRCVEGKPEEPAKKIEGKSKRPAGSWVSYSDLWRDHHIKRGELDRLVMEERVRVWHDDAAGDLYSMEDVDRSFGISEHTEKIMGELTGAKHA